MFYDFGVLYHSRFVFFSCVLLIWLNVLLPFFFEQVAVVVVER